ncbi:hypothetical protein [Borrelia hispanica]|uniref:hypothetical protein n=1 Tax=Borrelia hispanica TaxID=40835 RepID=UPI000465D2D5|nr:hypothetical protein [Borrelia hispanica]
MFNLFKVLSISMLISLVSCELYEHALKPKKLLGDKKNLMQNIEFTDESSITSYKVTDAEKSESGGSISMIGKPSDARLGKDLIANDIAQKSQRKVLAVKNNAQNNEIHKTNKFTKEQEDAIVAYDSEANDIMSKVNTKSTAINAMHSELSASLLTLENMQADITKATSDFEESRSSSKNGIDVSLKIKLEQAINKIKSSKNSAMVLHQDGINGLEHAKSSAEHARGLANSALSESRHLRTSNYYYGIRYYYISDAKKSLNSADDMFKRVKEKQDSLKIAIEQASKDFETLKNAHHALRLVRK